MEHGLIFIKFSSAEDFSWALLLSMFTLVDLFILFGVFLLPGFAFCILREVYRRIKLAHGLFILLLLPMDQQLFLSIILWAMHCLGFTTGRIKIYSLQAHQVTNVDMDVWDTMLSVCH